MIMLHAEDIRVIYLWVWSIRLYQQSIVWTTDCFGWRQREYKLCITRSLWNKCQGGQLKLKGPCGLVRHVRNPSKISRMCLKWWRHQMETFSALLSICTGNSPVPGEFPAQRPVTRSFDVFLDLHPNKRLSTQWWGWWFETPSCPLWPHRNEKYAQGLLCFWSCNWFVWCICWYSSGLPHCY